MKTYSQGKEKSREYQMIRMHIFCSRISRTAFQISLVMREICANPVFSGKDLLKWDSNSFILIERKSKYYLM